MKECRIMCHSNEDNRFSSYWPYWMRDRHKEHTQQWLRMKWNGRVIEENEGSQRYWREKNINEGINLRQKHKRKVRIRGLTWLTHVAKHVEHYCGHSNALVPLMAVVCKCQTDTENTSSNGNGQPQAVAQRCDIAIPSHVRVAG